MRAALAGGASGLLANAAYPLYASESAKRSMPVETSLGKVRGLDLGGGVSLFAGIPYGGPTEGVNRFRPPVNAASWTGVRDAVHVPPRCIQAPGSVFDLPIGDYFAGGRKDKLQLPEQTDSENCLFLNVLSPGAGQMKNCPVMVYIHGGGFASGSGVIALGADGLVREQNVVLVSVNHRLNVFGYLHLAAFNPKYANSGNAGLLDLVLALQWIRRNIASFGGDPNNVTIFGESGGGAKISALMAMPAAKGLFAKAIVESGSALRVATADEATTAANRILKKLGIPPEHIDRLQALPAAALFEASRSGPEENPAPRLGPVLDKDAIPQQTWDPAAPEVSANIPMIIGSCKDEATLFMGGKNGENFHLDAAGLQSRVAQYLKIPAADADRLIAVYKSERPGSNPSDVFFAIASDRMFRINAITQAERKVRQGKAAVYMYAFTYDTPADGGKYRAFHTAELPLVLRMVKYPESDPLSRQLSAAWAAFARHGHPNSGQALQWPRYTLASRDTMVFGMKSAIVQDPHAKERLALQSIAPNGSAL